jgi:hypothetical protein
MHKPPETPKTLSQITPEFRNFMLRPRRKLSPLRDRNDMSNATTETLTQAETKPTRTSLTIQVANSIKTLATDIQNKEQLQRLIDNDQKGDVIYRRIVIEHDRKLDALLSQHWLLKKYSGTLTGNDQNDGIIYRKITIEKDKQLEYLLKERSFVRSLLSTTQKKKELEGLLKDSQNQRIIYHQVVIEKDKQLEALLSQEWLASCWREAVTNLCVYKSGQWFSLPFEEYSSKSPFNQFIGALGIKLYADISLSNKPNTNTLAQIKKEGLQRSYLFNRIEALAQIQTNLEAKKYHYQLKKTYANVVILLPTMRLHRPWDCMLFTKICFTASKKNNELKNTISAKMNEQMRNLSPSVKNQFIAGLLKEIQNDNKTNGNKITQSRPLNGRQQIKADLLQLIRLNIENQKLLELGMTFFEWTKLMFLSGVTIYNPLPNKNRYEAMPLLLNALNPQPVTAPVAATATPEIKQQEIKEDERKNWQEQNETLCQEHGLFKTTLAITLSAIATYQHTASVFSYLSIMSNYMLEIYKAYNNNEQKNWQRLEQALQKEYAVSDTILAKAQKNITLFQQGKAGYTNHFIPWRQSFSSEVFAAANPPSPSHRA